VKLIEIENYSGFKKNIVLTTSIGMNLKGKQLRYKWLCIVYDTTFMKFPGQRTWEKTMCFPGCNCRYANEHAGSFWGNGNILKLNYNGCPAH
jgi:hypothetical protein